MRGGNTQGEAAFTGIQSEPEENLPSVEDCRLEIQCLCRILPENEVNNAEGLLVDEQMSHLRGIQTRRRWQ